ncbi:hypothetical protein SGRA_1977 [Saprospira grandis str. Lewin]|uniref:Uncharacterized protein n=1 Tax=Saprospira grandis (strain Lewin) TaxID=984262 RepID=H6L270_SAPGL|nr:hypothetical protein SGRA_1977 [Saprospira grandis str. Lewin]
MLFVFLVQKKAVKPPKIQFSLPFFSFILINC